MSRRPIGQIQRRTRRALLAPGRLLETREMACWVYRYDDPKRWQVSQARMSAPRFCERVGRGAGPGSPLAVAAKAAVT
jgi:hypothetical protein